MSSSVRSRLESHGVSLFRGKLFFAECEIRQLKSGSFKVIHTELSTTKIYRYLSFVNVPEKSQDDFLNRFNVIADDGFVHMVATNDERDLRRLRGYVDFMPQE